MRALRALCDDLRSTPCGVLLVVVSILVVSGCAQTASSAGALPVTSTPGAPAGGPLPARLIGNWQLAPAAVNVILNDQGNGSCPLPLAVATCSVQLALTATTYRWPNNLGLESGGGNVVVDKSEIDFFGAPYCGLQLPAGVGRYTWTITGVVLHFTSLNEDPCPRFPFLSDQSFTRAS